MIIVYGPDNEELKVPHTYLSYMGLEEEDLITFYTPEEWEILVESVTQFLLESIKSLPFCDYCDRTEDDGPCYECG